VKGEACDVVIVGGGPAGSTCARALTRAGADVVILDKAVFPRDKTCAGWITPAVVDAVELPIDEYRDGRVFQPISAFRTSRIGSGRLVSTRFDRTVSYGIRRCEFDHFLLQRSGARVRAGEALKSLRREGDGRSADGRGGRWIVNESIIAPLVIGAGGHFCPVARHVSDIRDGHAVEPIVAAQEIEVALTPAQSDACRVDDDTPELYLCDDLEGYGWCFRKGPVLNVGLGRQDTHQLARHVRDFVASLISWGRIPSDLPWHWKGHAYLLRGESRRPPVDDGVMLIGDAAGLAYARSGEGIRPAVESGLLAAEVAKDALGRGRCSRDDLEPYRARLESHFGNGAAAGPVSSRVPRMPRRAIVAIGQILLANQWFTREVFLKRWFLREDAPPLKAAAARSAVATRR
jgi:geranylgeranyl reductase family protein